MLIRFVGGPLHNRMLEVGPKPAVIHRHDTNTTPICLEVGESGLVPEAHYSREEVYELNRFRTGRGTRYLQYVHKSLVSNSGKPHVSTYKEKFKPWKLNCVVR